MNSRERFYMAVEHEEPDRVPMDIWITPAAYERVRDYLGITAVEDQEWGIMAPLKVSEEFLQRLHIDFRRVYMIPSDKFMPRTDPDGTTDTEFGFRGKWYGPYWEITYHPWAEFTEVEQVETYEWPDPEDPSRMRGVVEWARHLHEETDKAVVGMVGGPWGVFEICAHYMRGFEAFLLDMMERPRLAEAMMDKSMRLAIEMNRVFLDGVGEYLDIVQVGDDLGHQHGLIMSPKLFRSMVKPRLKKIYRDIKRRAPHIKLLYHTCGAVEPLISDLIDIGVDILNPVQPLAKGMDSFLLKERYGDRLTFHGGIDLQEAMSEMGSVEDVKKEVDTRIRAFAPGGGYILAPAHNIQPDSTPEQIVTLYDYAHERGRYPLRFD